MSVNGTHGLRKRCPCCRKIRKFYEPPGDQGGQRVPRMLKWKPVWERLGFQYDQRRPLWTLTPFGWGCVWCAMKYVPARQDSNPREPILEVGA